MLFRSMSVIRLRSEKKEQLIELADKILQVWRTYSDPSVQVLAESEGEPHHTITPIARRKDGRFELDLVLRDNQTYCLAFLKSIAYRETICYNQEKEVIYEFDQSINN